jgi:hypothetical protein
VSDHRPSQRRSVHPIDPLRRRLRPAPVVLLLIPLAASAQTQQARAKAAVLEFRVAAADAPGDLGYVTAQVVSDRLAATGRYEMIAPAQVMEATRKAGLRPPFGVGHLQLLADVLGAQVVVHGSVRALAVDPAAGRASVTLSAEVVDGRTGDLKQKAEASGSHTAGAAVASSRQEVVVQALAEAAAKLAEAITGVAVEAPVSTQGASAAAAAPGVQAPPAPALIPPAAAVAADVPVSSAPRLELFPKPAVASRPQHPPGTTTGTATPSAGGGESAAEPTPSGREAGVAEPPAPREDGGLAVQPLVEAKVLAKVGSDQVLITLGRDALVTPKMVLDVYRITFARGSDTPNYKKIGRIRVGKIGPTDAEARILEGGPLIRTGDMAYFFGQ